MEVNPYIKKIFPKIGTLKITFAMMSPIVKITNPKTQKGNNLPIIN